MTTPLFHILTNAALADSGSLEIEGVSRIILITPTGELRDARGAVPMESLADAEIAALLVGRVSPKASEIVDRIDRDVQRIETRIELAKIDGETLNATMLRFVAGLLFGRYRTLCGLLSESKAQTIALRNSLDRNARAFKALETYHAGTEFGQGKLLYASGEWDSGRAPSECVALSETGGPLRQRLPVESGGLNLIRIFVGFSGRTGKMAGGEMRVRLLDDDLGATVCEWRIAGDGARGWRSLGLREGYVEPYRALSLEIAPAGGKGVEIGLSAPLASDRYSVETAKRGPLGRALAIEIRAGLPGVRADYAASIARDARPAGAARGWLKVPLSEVAGGHVAALSDTSWAQGFQPVAADQGLTTIACHPPPGGRITVARVDCLSGVALRSVDALISLNNDRANPVDFAIAAGPASAAEIERRLTQRPDDSSGSRLGDSPIHFSGWKTLAARESHHLHLDLDDDCAPGSVMFLTRMRGGASNDYAWAQFSNPLSVVQATWERPMRPTDDA